MFTTLLTIGLIVLAVSVIGKFLGLALKVAGIIFVIGLLVALSSIFFR